MRFSRRQEVFLVFSVSGIGLIINQVILYIFISLMSFDMVLSKVIATGCVFFWNYGARTKFIFGDLESESAR